MFDTNFILTPGTWGMDRSVLLPGCTDSMKKRTHKLAKNSRDAQIKYFTKHTNVQQKTETGISLGKCSLLGLLSSPFAPTPRLTFLVDTKFFGNKQRNQICQLTKRSRALVVNVRNDH